MGAVKLLALLALILSLAHRAPAQTIEEVYKKALTEGGTLSFYGTWHRSTQKSYCRCSRSVFRASK